MRLYLSILTVAVAWSAVGCGGEEFAEANELESYRMLGLLGTRSAAADRPESPAPDLYLDEVLSPRGVEVAVEMVDFDPKGVRREYRHTLCFSVGAATRFECLAPESVLTCGSGVETPMGCVADGPRAVFQLTPATAGGLLGLLGGSETGGGGEADAGCAELTATMGRLLEVARSGCPVSLPLPLVARTEVISPDGAIRVAARTVKVRLPIEFIEGALAQCGVEVGEAVDISPAPGADHACMEDVGGRPLNRNPAVEAITVGERRAVEADAATGCLRFPAAGRPGDTVPITVTLSSCSVERFLAYSEVDGCKVVNEADLGSAAMTFYADGGTLLYGDRRLDVGETALTLPDAAGFTRIYVAVRDGRNGLDIGCADIETVAP